MSRLWYADKLKESNFWEGKCKIEIDSGYKLNEITKDFKCLKYISVGI